MGSGSFYRFVLLCIGMQAFLSGCGSLKGREYPTVEQSKEIRAGPLIELLHVKTSSDKVRAIADAGGRVHCVIASSELRQVVEIVVDQAAVLQRHVIRSGVSPSSIDAAFDDRGRLHVLLDAQHLVFDHGAWYASSDTPWQKTGLNVEEPRFVAGAPHLIWAFQVHGGEVGGPVRWDWYAIGGGMGGALIWTWPTRGVRQVLVSETSTGEGPWVVLEPHGKEDTEAFSLSADRQGDVYLTYGRGGSGPPYVPSLKYAKLGAEMLLAAATSNRAAVAQNGTKRVIPFEGHDGTLEGITMDSGNVVADPENENVLVGLRWLVRGTKLSGPFAFPAAEPMEAAYTTSVPSGGDMFDAVMIGEPRDQFWGTGFPVLYLAFSRKGWSAPAQLGLARDVTFRRDWVPEVDLASTQNGKAFVAWAAKDGIVGRWVERIK